MCSVYRCFVKYYAHITKPLTKITTKNLSHVLSALDVVLFAAFYHLKQRLALTLMLALSLREGLCILNTDSRAFQVGCSMLQQQSYTSIVPVGE